MKLTDCPSRGDDSRGHDRAGEDGVGDGAERGEGGVPFVLVRRRGRPRPGLEARLGQRQASLGG